MIIRYAPHVFLTCANVWPLNLLHAQTITVLRFVLKFFFFVPAARSPLITQRFYSFITHKTKDLFCVCFTQIGCGTTSALIAQIYFRRFCHSVLVWNCFSFFFLFLLRKTLIGHCMRSIVDYVYVCVYVWRCTGTHTNFEEEWDKKKTKTKRKKSRKHVCFGLHRIIFVLAERQRNTTWSVSVRYWM